MRGRLKGESPAGDGRQCYAALEFKVIISRLLPFLGLSLCMLLVVGCRVGSTEVVLVGSIHHFHLLHSGNSPAHLRALLERIRPDVITVENPPSWTPLGRHFWIHLPEHAVASDYARRTGAELRGIDLVSDVPCFWGAPSVDADDGRQRLSAIMGQRRWEAELTLDASWGLAAVQNRIEPPQMDPASRAALDDSVSAQRSDSLTTRIVRLARSHPGRRIAVVIGSSQLYPLATRLAAHHGLTLLDARDYLPTERDVVAAATSEDRILLLGFLVDRWLAGAFAHVDDLDRAEALLHDLDHDGKRGMVVEYYWARLEQLRNERAAASYRLDQVLASRHAVVLPAIPNSEWNWPPWDHLDWKAKFVRALLHDLDGEHGAAVQIYRYLADSLPPDRLRPRFRGPVAYYDLSWYLNDLIKTPYRGGNEEALRIQAALRCWGVEGMPAEAWPR